MVMNQGIKLRHIRAFLDIAAEGKLSSAAQTLGLTQPALSRSLAELELLIGQPLFLRQGRRLVLSDAGTLFRRHAMQAVQALDTGAAALKPGQRRGLLRIAVLPTVATKLFPKVALHFRALRPDVVLCVETGSNLALLRRLRDGDVDLMIGRMPSAAAMAGLAFEHLYEEDVVLCGRADHPLAALPVAEVLKHSPLVLPPHDAIIRHVVDDYLSSLGLAGLQPAFETTSLAVGRGLVVGSDAVWFISRGVIADELEQKRLMLFATGARFMSGAVGLTRRQTTVPMLDLDLLIEITKQMAGRDA